MEETISDRAKSRREHAAKAVDVVEAINFNNDGLPVMTSLAIAEITGKRHCHVLRAIRNLEPAWEKVVGTKFGFTSQEIPQPNGGIRLEDYYVLTEHECLYIATKFNDEARARLVMRWLELEQSNARKVQALPTAAADIFGIINGLTKGL